MANHNKTRFRSYVEYVDKDTGEIISKEESKNYIIVGHTKKTVKYEPSRKYGLANGNITSYLTTHTYECERNRQLKLL